MLVAEKVDSIRNSYAGYEYLAACHIPNYHEHIRKIHEFSETLGDAHELDKESADYIEHCKANIGTCNAFIKDFTSAQQTLFDHIREKEEEKNDRVDSRRISWIQCLISMLGGVVLGGLVTYFFFT